MDPQQPQDPQRPQPEAQLPPPPAEPGWAPPPGQGQGNWGQAGYAPPARPGGVTFAGVYLIVMGGLMALAGAACGLMGGAVGGMLDFEGTGMGGFIGGSIVFVGIVVLVIGIISIVAGIGALQGKGWGRVTGIVVAVIFTLLLGLSVLSSLGAGVDATGMLVSVLILAGYVVTAWALIQAGPYFAFRR